MKQTLLLFITTLLCSCAGTGPQQPEPYGPIPSEAQLEWQKMEYYMFAHFGPNTFTDVEWGDGTEHPDVFNPTDLDCRQWARIARDAGMTGIILTAKHHDGFCLWPSQYSSHTVRESKWRDGQGDVLAELSQACREYELKFGVYVSPWDQNHPAYGTPEYNQIFANTLREVLTGYGPVFEQWLDGANGEGPDGRKQPYDWELFHETIYECQPSIIIFSDVGPGCRWIGNEDGYAGRTMWSRLDTEGFAPGLDAPVTDTLNTGNIYGGSWVPGEADVSIRPGWFYSPNTDDKVKSVKELMDIYYASVGRNATLLLNVPPDRRGKINPADSARLMEFRLEREKVFARDLAQNAEITSDVSRGKGYEPSNMFNGDYDMYWSTPDDVNTATIRINFDRPTEFDCIVLQEYIPLGQRVKKFTVSCTDISTGEPIEPARETTIGYKRIINFEKTESTEIFVKIEESLAAPLISHIKIYNTSGTSGANL